MSWHSKDVASFWKMCPKHTKKLCQLPLLLIVPVTYLPYLLCGKYILNPCKYATCERVCTKCREFFYKDNNIHITPCMVHNPIDALKYRKSCGNDGVSAEHFKHADRRINILLSSFYTSVLTYEHLPDDFIKTIIVTLMRKKFDDTSDVNNYTPIALITVACLKLYCMN